MSSKRNWERAKAHRLLNTRQVEPGLCRWQLNDGKWFIIGPEGTIQPGNVVRVQSRKGTQTKQITAVIQDEAGAILGIAG